LRSSGGRAFSWVGRRLTSASLMDVLLIVRAGRVIYVRAVVGARHESESESLNNETLIDRKG
jgi:hypothetical protein